MDSINEWLNDVASAVRRFGGVEKTAQFLKISNESMENYARTGCLPKDLAKKLGRMTNVHWKFLMSPE